MSKLVGQLLSVAVVYFLCATAGGNVVGQDMDVRVIIEEGRSFIAHINGRSLAPSRRELTFLDNYAGIGDLANRISGVKLADKEGHEVAFQKIASGHYVAASDLDSFAYDVAISPPMNRGASSHVSWTTPFLGMLVLDDLLPQPTDRLHVRLTLELPRRWRILTSENKTYENTIDIPDARRTVIFIGENWAVSAVGGTPLKLAMSGASVPFDTAAANVATIYNGYVRIFGSAPPGSPAQIAIIRPENSSGGSWEAETRGSTVTIISSGGLSPADAEQRLGQQLRHELFHLWFPNGVNLSGNYDWFYEGFAVYEAQKIGVAMNQIRFEDFLSTLARAYDIDRFATRRSLVDASRDRWAGASSQVYARGMLVAFLCDIALLDASKGRSSVESLERQLFEEHKPPTTAVNGNDAVIAAMRSHPELAGIVEDYVNGSKDIDRDPLLEKAGIQAATRDQLTQLSVRDKLSGRQKALLDKLGYNNWRKLAPK